MKATLIRKYRTPVSDAAFVEAAIWRVPKPLAGSRHNFKYRLALIVEGRCVLRYDNEAGKGDHKHIGRKQVDYHFQDLTQLQGDFRNDVEEWLRRLQT